MLNRKKWKRMLATQQKKSALYVWIQTEIAKINYDLSDHYCRFYIKPAIEQKGMSLIIQVNVQPLSGTFASIEFKPKIFISCFNFTHRPRIYNDRRLFHPNINMYTCQIVFPEIIREWNPTQQFTSIFHHLKYTLLEPNLKFVPNTQFNKRAAWNYHFNKKNYRNLIIENCPLYLENLIGHEFEMQKQSQMDIEGNNENQQTYNQDDYWNIQVLTVRKSALANIDDNSLYDDEENSILLLTKQIKCLDMSEDIEEKHLSQYESMQQ